MCTITITITTYETHHYLCNHHKPTTTAIAIIGTNHHWHQTIAV